MNVVYRVVWNSTTNTWVVASEMAKGRKKKASPGMGGVALAVLATALGGMGAAGDASASINSSGNFDACKAGPSIGSDFTANGVYTGSFGCGGIASATMGVTDAYGSTMAAIHMWGGNSNSMLIESRGTLALYSMSHIEIDATTSLEGHRITNLAAGSAGTDAVNVDQLKAVEAKIGTRGGTDANAVHYDTGTSNGRVTLAGTGGTTITNVKAGDVSSATSTDAVNGSQLFTTNQNVTNLTNNVNTLNTTVNGLLDDALVWSDAASAYSAQHDGVDARITNLAAGTVGSTSTDAINGAQLHGTAQSVADALGGGSTVAADGTISKPKYNVNKIEQEGVQAAIEALDARFDNIGPGGDSLNWDAVTTAYNAQRDGDDQRITGVADGTENNDAVNKGQLDLAVKEIKDSTKEIAPKLKYLKFGASAAPDAQAHHADQRCAALGCHGQRRRWGLQRQAWNPDDQQDRQRGHRYGRQ